MLTTASEISRTSVDEEHGGRRKARLAAAPRAAGTMAPREAMSPCLQEADEVDSFRRRLEEDIVRHCRQQRRQSSQDEQQQQQERRRSVQFAPNPVSDVYVIPSRRCSEEEESSVSSDANSVDEEEATSRPSSARQQAKDRRRSGSRGRRRQDDLRKRSKRRSKKEEEEEEVRRMMTPQSYADEPYGIGKGMTSPTLVMPLMVGAVYVIWGMTRL